MTEATNQTWTVHDHVPAELIRDVDSFNLPGGSTDPFLAWHRVQLDAPDMLYSGYYGGYWIPTRSTLIREMLSDPERFCSSLGTTIPPMPAGSPRYPPLLVDPPDHSYFKRPLMFALGPQKLNALEIQARGLATNLIEQLLPQGECEFVTDIALQIPIRIVMGVLDFPFSDSAFLTPLSDTFTHNSDEAARADALNTLTQYVEDWVRKRAASPGDDLTSQILRSPAGDRLISQEEAAGIVILTLLGGLDTISNSMGAIIRFLATSPPHRKELMADAKLPPGAVEELFRRHTVGGAGRTVVSDLVFHDVQMKAGDRIFLCPWLANLDPKEWDQPLEVRFDRPLKNSATFGRGVHSCVGAYLARLEISVLLEEWLKRIPDFEL